MSHAAKKEGELPVALMARGALYICYWGGVCVVIT